MYRPDVMRSDLQAVVACDHGEARQPAFGELGLADVPDVDSSEQTEIELVGHQRAAAISGSNSHCSNDRFSTTILAVKVMPGSSVCRLPYALTNGRAIIAVAM